MSKPVIVVFGATGAQGGSVLRSLLHDGHFAVRAVTRDPAAPKAKELEKLGVEVVQGDLTDVEATKRALQGAYGVFFVTFFWHAGEAGEAEQGRVAVQASKEVGTLKHIVFSGLENTGKFKVPHFTGKALVEKAFFESGLPVTSVHVGFYVQNLLTMMAPRKQDDGSLALVMPTGDAPLGMIDIDRDLGPIVTAIFKQRDMFLGKIVLASTHTLSIPKLAALATAAVGRPVRHVDMPCSAYAKLGFPGAEELAEMFAYLVQEQPYRDAPLQARALFPGAHSDEEMVREVVAPVWKNL